eukprot:363169-Chlamydomonas_euryale.AAC.1
MVRHAAPYAAAAAARQQLRVAEVGGGVHDVVHRVHVDEVGVVLVQEGRHAGRLERRPHQQLLCTHRRRGTH